MKIGKMDRERTKSFKVSQEAVYESYLKVCVKDGGAGIDKETIEGFNKNLGGNLYKIWNRMASGSYQPPLVRTVLIPKKQGGFRPLGIPTVGDRIAQGVVKIYLEPILEPLFHINSFGYRPNRSAHDALVQCDKNCKMHSWVVDLDIRGFFDNINHELMMKMVSYHTEEKWVLLYTERWLKVGAEQPDGSIMSREKGTPQGGVISPLLANLYLHHAFDMWMEKYFSNNPFERYADDIIVHCNSKLEGEKLLESIRERLLGFDLELHPEKTKLVYCQDYKRGEKHEQNSFVFLSYSFQPRRMSSKFDARFITAFGAAICCKAKVSIRQGIRSVFDPHKTHTTLEHIAKMLNPKIRGWLNYYSRFNADMAKRVFYYLNELIRKWMKKRYKLLSMKLVVRKYDQYLKTDKDLFYHWQKGII
jgi:group II intron reverse transcriptase/maturase